jgi:hypothetical protein
MGGGDGRGRRIAGDDQSRPRLDSDLRPQLDGEMGIRQEEGNELSRSPQRRAVLGGDPLHTCARASASDAAVNFP